MRGRLGAQAVEPPRDRVDDSAEPSPPTGEIRKGFLPVDRDFGPPAPFVAVPTIRWRRLRFSARPARVHSPDTFSLPRIAKKWTRSSSGILSRRSGSNSIGCPDPRIQSALPWIETPEFSDALKVRQTPSLNGARFGVASVSPCGAPGIQRGRNCRAAAPTARGPADRCPSLSLCHSS